MKITYKYIAIVALAFLLQSCQKNEDAFDATGTFEAKEIIISSQTNGTVLKFGKDEGSNLLKGELVALVDTMDTHLQIEQIRATMNSINFKTNDSKPQVAILQEQKMASESQIKVIETKINVALKEKARISSLVDASAATTKQLDDVSGQLEILQSNLKAASSSLKVLDAQISAAQKNVNTQNRAITSEKEPLSKRLEILASQLNKATIKSPIDGTLISKYVYEDEFVSMGRPIAKIADLSELLLRAYIGAEQLEGLQLGQEVQVNVDQGKGYKAYKGKLMWVSEKAEFTPKTIQTKNERANLVYAVKISVQNDGFLKIGMYGELDFLDNAVADE